MTHPAMQTPAKHAANAWRFFRPNRWAASEPVQAPVIGNGIATNITRPHASYCWIRFP